MTILRIQKKQNPFVILDKRFLQDTQLSWQARGLLAYLLSLPDNWKVSLKELEKHGPAGRDAMRAMINHLIEQGYIIRDEAKRDNGRFQGYDYIVCETPQLGIDSNPSDLKQGDLSDNESDSTVSDFPSSAKNEQNSEEKSDSTVSDLPATVKTAPTNPPLINNKNKININNTKQAAEKSEAYLSDKEISSKINMPAAAMKKMEREQVVQEVIGRVLTKLQKNAINAAILELQLSVAIQSPKTMYQSIETCLLDKTSFTQSGNLFWKKLNTIKKQIREGKWVISQHVRMSAAVLTEEEKKRLELQSRITELQNEKHSQEKALVLYGHREPRLVQSFRSGIARCEQEIQRLGYQLKKLITSEPTEEGVLCHE